MARLADAERAMNANSVAQSDGTMFRGFPALYLTLTRGRLGFALLALSLGALVALLIWLFV